MALQPLGFIKEVAGQKRLRMVKAGNDADDLDLPANQVVIDSEYLNTVGVYLAGSWTGTITLTKTKIVTWPSLGYVPMITVWVSAQSDPNELDNTIWTGSNGGNQICSVDETGIWIRHHNSNIPAVVRYLVHRLKADGS